MQFCLATSIGAGPLKRKARPGAFSSIEWAWAVLAAKPEGRGAFGP